MSRYIHGVPRDIVLCLRDEYKLDTFIETGTLVGYSAHWASRHFKRVFTIEIFEDFFKLAQNKLACRKNVTCIKNKSIFGLEELIQKIGKTAQPLFWLDAHWSEEAPYGRPMRDTEVDEEIMIVNRWTKPHAIIVDDAHKFSTSGWPDINYIIALLDNSGKREVKRVYDVLLAVPRTI